MLQRWVEWCAALVEVTGIATILVGAVVAVPLVWRNARGGIRDWYPLYRRYLGHAILLGLEFLVAADIIRTVSHAPTLRDVLVLALVVLIRTFLSFTMELEVEGRWPWEKKPHGLPPP